MSLEMFHHPLRPHAQVLDMREVNSQSLLRTYPGVPIEEYAAAPGVGKKGSENPYAQTYPVVSRSYKTRLGFPVDVKIFLTGDVYTRHLEVQVSDETTHLRPRLAFVNTPSVYEFLARNGIKVPGYGAARGKESPPHQHLYQALIISHKKNDPKRLFYRFLAPSRRSKGASRWKYNFAQPKYRVSGAPLLHLKQPLDLAVHSISIGQMDHGRLGDIDKVRPSRPIKRPKPDASHRVGSKVHERRRRRVYVAEKIRQLDAFLSAIPADRLQPSTRPVHWGGDTSMPTPRDASVPHETAQRIVKKWNRGTVAANPGVVSYML